MYIGLRVKCPLILSYFNQTSILYTAFRKKKHSQIKCQNIRPVGVELFHVSRLDATNSRFSKFCTKA